jgi:excisionase family DNA binding protein
MNNYTVEDVAKIFQYHPATIRRLIKKGRIFAFRLGNGKKSPYRIKHEEIERLIEIGFEEQIKELRIVLQDN